MQEPYLMLPESFEQVDNYGPTLKATKFWKKWWLASGNLT